MATACCNPYTATPAKEGERGTARTQLPEVSGHKTPAGVQTGSSAGRRARGGGAPSHPRWQPWSPHTPALVCEEVGAGAGHPRQACHMTAGQARSRKLVGAAQAIHDACGQACTRSACAARVAPRAGHKNGRGRLLGAPIHACMRARMRFRACTGASVAGSTAGCRAREICCTTHAQSWRDSEGPRVHTEPARDGQGSKQRPHTQRRQRRPRPLSPRVAHAAPHINDRPSLLLAGGQPWHQGRQHVLSLAAAAACARAVAYELHIHTRLRGSRLGDDAWCGFGVWGGGMRYTGTCRQRGVLHRCAARPLPARTKRSANNWLSQSHACRRHTATPPGPKKLWTLGSLSCHCCSSSLPSNSNVRQ